VAETPRPAAFARDVVVIGGCGHVGLPLAIAFASRGLRVGIFDVSEPAVECVNSARMPFAEPGAETPLARAIAAGTLEASTDPAIVGTGEHVVVVIGTPVGENLEPDQSAIPNALQSCAAHLGPGQILILRSTVYPGVTARVEKMVVGLGMDIDVAFCPERIAEGKAMTELFELPQIVSSRTARGQARASELFRRLTPTLVPMRPEEAELAKLFTNVWRYIKFAISNQLYMMANDRGLISSTFARGWPWITRGPRTCPAPDSRPARAYSRTQCSSPLSTTTILRSATPRWPLMKGCHYTWWPALSSVST